VRTGFGNAHPVNVMNDAKENGEDDHAMAGAGGRGGGIHEKRSENICSAMV